MVHHVLIALGANLPLSNRGLIANLRHGASAIQACDKLRVTQVSGVYSTSPVGGAGRQPYYVNAVIEVEGSVSPGELLRILKRIERDAGRRQRGLNAPRPLDLDLIDHSGRVYGWRTPWKTTRARGRIRRRHSILVLPHPLMHHRRFVLEPLSEVRPYWRHPVLGRSISQLSRRLTRAPGSIRRVLDSGWFLCDTESEILDMDGSGAL